MAVDLPASCSEGSSCLSFVVSLLMHQTSSGHQADYENEEHLRGKHSLPSLIRNGWSRAYSAIIYRQRPIASLFGPIQWFQSREWARKGKRSLNSAVAGKSSVLSNKRAPQYSLRGHLQVLIKIAIFGPKNKMPVGKTWQVTIFFFSFFSFFLFLFFSFFTPPKLPGIPQVGFVLEIYIESLFS